jgi:aminopeptidase N
MSSNLGQIIAIGGGGFGRSIYNTKIDKYIIDQSPKENPNICFIPTASAEDKAYTVNFYAVYSKLNCNPSHINFFQRTPRIDSIINKQDIIFVGGGNTKSMLAVWKEWKLDKLLLKAYNRGAILCGVSAGAICWFKEGVTDSWASNLNIIDCLDFIPGCCCPHYDGEKNRKPSVEKFLIDEKIDSCIAIDDEAAIHYKNGKFYKSINFGKNKNSYIVKKIKENIVEEKLDKINLK